MILLSSGKITPSLSQMMLEKVQSATAQLSNRTDLGLSILQFVMPDSPTVMLQRTNSQLVRPLQEIVQSSRMQLLIVAVTFILQLRKTNPFSAMLELVRISWFSNTLVPALMDSQMSKNLIIAIPPVCLVVSEDAWINGKRHKGCFLCLCGQRFPVPRTGLCSVGSSAR